jgi:high frequency lysogenization protein
MKYSKRDQTLALAGVFQAASLVQKIANKGMANSAVIESSIESLFKFDIDTVEQFFGNLSGINTGLKTLKDQLSLSSGNHDIELSKYVIALLVLEKKLSKNSQMLETISSTLEEIQGSLEFFSLMHENIFLKIGNLYKETISTLGPRIIVSGDRSYLSNEGNTNKVRSLLLAGIRSAVLWRQCNGTRWQILFGRKSYLHECDMILSEM